MCRVKRFWVLICCIFILAASAGCAGPAANAPQTSGPVESLRPGYEVVYHPKLQPGASLGSIQKELGRLGAKKSWCVFVSDDSPQYREWYILLHMNIDADMIQLKKYSSVYKELSNHVYSLSNKELPLGSFYTTFSNYNLLKAPIVVERNQEGGNYPFVIFFENLITFRFYKGDLSMAQTIADALYFLQKEQRDMQAKLQAKLDEQLARFQPIATQYRGLAIKPPVTEAQRRLIVQANALNQRKDYAGAIDFYLKAVELDPVSYPGAYFNLALLSAQLQRFSPAITYMKQYLLLVPDAPDARSAQDKIYEWEFMNQQKK